MGEEIDRTEVLVCNSSHPCDESDNLQQEDLPCICVEVTLPSARGVCAGVCSTLLRKHYHAVCIDL